MNIDHTHDASASSWVNGADAHSDFPVQNLPLGIFSHPNSHSGICTAIGDFVLDLAALVELGVLPNSVGQALRQPNLNAFFALAISQRVMLRHTLFHILTDPTQRSAIVPHLYPASDCTLHLPMAIGDYTDFYVGIHHASNIGKLFRPDNPLLPNYKHLPIGYHGRASSIQASGAQVHRPNGQRMPPGATTPEFGPTQRLDYELEMGVWIAGGNDLGAPILIADALKHVAGFCLLNDWSARDLQAWEYQPLGPFLAKNFLTTVSPWVITAEAMIPFMTAHAPRHKDDPHPLPYLWDAKDQSHGALSVTLEVQIATQAMRQSGGGAVPLSKGPATNMYWTVAQMIAHHTSNGCNLQTGDLLGTGTISGPTPSSFGSLMELSQGGAIPISLPGDETRAFLEDGDEVTFAGHAHADGFRSIGFGVCTGKVAIA